MQTHACCRPLVIDLLCRHILFPEFLCRQKLATDLLLSIYYADTHFLHLLCRHMLVTDLLCRHMLATDLLLSIYYADTYIFTNFYADTCLLLTSSYQSCRHKFVIEHTLVQPHSNFRRGGECPKNGQKKNGQASATRRLECNGTMTNDNH
jgi:hypothetical protein